MGDDGADGLRRDRRYYAHLARELASSLRRARPGDNLVLHCLSLLTRIEVALVFIVAPSFTDVGFVKPRGAESAVYLSQLYGSTKEAIDLLGQVERALRDGVGDQELLGVLPMADLLRNDRFYSTIVAFNISCMKERALAKLEGF